MSNNYFNELNQINVNDYVDKKGKLTYLSWSYAWSEIKKVHPHANFEIHVNNDGFPCFGGEFGFFCSVSVTINDITHNEMLPVLDGANKAQKQEAYVYTVYDKYKKVDIEKRCEAIDSFSINKTIKRCLAKACALHGLGLYIYNGEDLPEGPTQEELEKKYQESLEKIRIMAKNCYSKEELGTLRQGLQDENRWCGNALQILKERFEQINIEEKAEQAEEEDMIQSVLKQEVKDMIESR